MLPPLNNSAPVNSPTPPVKESQVVASVKEDSELNLPYVDKTSVVISLISDINVSSSYRRMNHKHLSDRQDYIGSSINSTRHFLGNSAELAAYMPMIIGLGVTHPDFLTRASAWFSNIQVRVDKEGYTLDTSFRFNKKYDYNNYNRKLEAIDTEFEQADKSDTIKFKNAVTEKIRKLIDLESTKYAYGMPVNVTHYLIYRHCLMYKDVAKDIAVSSFDAHVRFYIKDENKLAERAKKRQLQINKARKNYIDCISDDTIFDNVFTVYCVSGGLDLSNNRFLDRSVKEQMLDRYSSENPDKFNAIFTNKHLNTIAFIEKCIASSLLRRSELNQNISLPDGTFIGANVKEAVVYFNNADNGSVKSALEQQLSLS